jgi:hypothetical protein
MTGSDALYSETKDASGAAPSLLLAGPWDQGEFAALRSELDPHRRWTSFPSIQLAVNQAIESELPPELILLAQLRPADDQQQQAIDRLYREAPLTRVIAVSGTWCEGELRTGKPLHGVIRIYWYDFPRWWRSALARWERGEAPLWSQPLMDPRSGQAFHSPSIAGVANKGRMDSAEVVVIDAADIAVFETLKAALSPLGWQCEWQPRHRPELASVRPTIGIWDGGQLEPGELESLRAFCRRLKEFAAPVIALLDFPRLEHQEMAKAAGAAAIFGKPYTVAALIDELHALSGKPNNLLLLSAPSA